ncbi:MAG: choice-of-anchor L domain-containing protein, partial [Cyanobacteriota bacterium]
MSQDLSLLLPGVHQALSNLASSDRFWEVIHLSFGDNFDQIQARALQQQWKDRDFSRIPTIELVEQNVLGSAFGGYASSTNTIYLSRDFLLRQDRSIVTQVIVEEIGHFVDFTINKEDSAGDEGKIFAKLSLGQDLSQQEMRLLQSIDDRTTINVNQENLSIEQSSLVLEDLLSHTPADLVSALLGSGVSAIDISYTGTDGAAGIFSGGLAAGIGIDSGIVLSTGNILNAIGPNDLTSTSTAFGVSGDIDLDDIVGFGSTYDACILEFTFIPSASIVSFSFVFASEEYPEFVGSQFNDVFAFFVNDVNIAIIPGTTTPVSINNVSPVTNSSFYISNELNTADVEFDGFTTVLSAVASSLAPGIPASVKLAIADTSDAIYDSAVFIQAGSFANPTLVTVSASDPSAVEDTSSSSRSGEFIISRTGSTTNPLTVSFSLSGSASAADYAGIPTVITIPAGESSAIVTIAPIDDALLEGNETVILSLIDGTGYDLGLPSSATVVLEDNETQPVNITLAVNPATVVEDQGLPLIFTFTRSGSVSNPLTVNYNVGGSAKFNLDYTQTGASTYSGTAGSVFFASGSNTASITISPGQDLDVEPNETVALTLAAGTGYLVGTATAVTGFINDDDQSITLSVSPSSVAEDGSTSIVYTFVRTGVTSNPLTVNYTVSGSAAFNSDYTQAGASSFTGISGTVSFAPGASVAVIAVDPTADFLLETDETVSLALATGSGYTIATPGQVTATIIESPPPVITLELSPASVLENESNNLVYTFTRTGATTSALTVSYSVAGTASLGIDYTGIGAEPSTKSVTFAAGSATATVSVDPSGDNTGELNETVTLSLLEGLGYTIGTFAPVTGTIVNDDAIFSSAFDLVLLQDLSGSFGDDISNVRTLIPNLISDVNSLQPNTPIGISSFVDKPVSPFGGGLDYVYRTDQSLTTDSATLQSIYDGLSILYGDDSPEAQLEALLQVASRPSEIGFRAGTKRVVVLFTDASYHVAGDGAAVGITTPNNLDAILDGTPAGTGEDYPGVAQLGQKLIDANILPIFAVTTDQVNVYQALLQDLSIPGSVVTLDSNSSNITDAIRSGLANLFFVNITAPTSGLVTDENGGTATFSVELSIQPTADVSISLQLSDPTEGTLSTSSLLFTSTNWNTPQIITVTGIDDPESTGLLDGDQPYLINTGLVASADPNYNGLNPIDIAVVNQDRDTNIISLATSPVSVTEDGSSNLIFTFTRSGDTTAALDVNYTVAGTATLVTDYTGISKKRTIKTISFAAGSSTATVTVDPKADTELEADETVELTMVGGTGYTIGTTAAVIGTISNDDLPLITLAVSPKTVTEDGTSNLVYTFTRTGDNTSALDVNYTVAGTATLGTDYTGIARKRTTKTVAFAAGASTATVTIDPKDDTEIESDETIELTLISGTGYSIGTTSAVLSTISNDDLPVITLALSPKAVTEDGANSLLYTFTRTGETTAALDVYYTVAGSAILGTDYTG